MKCSRCGKVLKQDMEIEYSKEICEYFCQPDCATDTYFDHMMSRPLDEVEKKTLLKNHPEPKGGGK